jgi:hypothetical protein
MSKEKLFIWIVIHQWHGQFALESAMWTLGDIESTGKEKLFGLWVLPNIKQTLYITHKRLAALWAVDLGVRHKNSYLFEKFYFISN